MRSKETIYECEFKTASGYIGNASIVLTRLDRESIKKELARIGIANVVAVRIYDQKLNRVF